MDENNIIMTLIGILGSVLTYVITRLETSINKNTEILNKVLLKIQFK